MTFREQLINNILIYYLTMYNDKDVAIKLAISVADQTIKELSK